MESISDRISKIVKDNNLTKTAFARRLNISQSMASMLCLGTASPSDRTISDICREFQVNENWLRLGVGEMYSDSTQVQKLNNFFGKVLATAPDARSAFVAALDDLPDEFWPLVLELAKNAAAQYQDNTKKD